MIVIIDYGLGNLGSIYNMIKKVGDTACITSEKDAIAAASKIILPGVGSFDQGIKNLSDLDLIDLVRDKASEKVPILGICLGMQMLMEKSQEGDRAGLGLVKGEVIKFSNDKAETDIRVPHMGWNSIVNVKDDKIFRGLDITSRFYYVHSYHVSAEDKYVLAYCRYGYDFPAVIRRNNIYGVQFHPEKSHRFGMDILRNFVNL